MKKVTLIAAATALVLGLCFTGASFANDANGPAEITLESTIDKAKKAKPAVFPHAKHQEKLTCGDCHHSKDADGKQVAYVEGQKIEKCESCHNKAAGMPDKLSTFKDAAHANCKECHKKTDKALAKCTVCHPKK
ncbi:class III cytochrome C family protein [Desulfocapsa sulfexigens DSM 10523]|uniref:Class III cytochrome C family protein n=1 Tax=Desulfocapsa sulfexigens (strain DSM 10523 / SB164P1) TaxID=1167006 RepID=M1P5U5_DESSD|nr:cytochrome c3 family protein [Desulfocapsa sulfexigens]AGF78858.1 class III cytochrome C family protein [Desulfocapsa sulfexigens DSM 10523]